MSVCMEGEIKEGSFMEGQYSGVGCSLSPVGTCHGESYHEDEEIEALR